MKPVMEYTSLKELTSDFMKEKNLEIYISIGTYEGRAGIYEPDTNVWYSDARAAFDVQDNQFSCAINEWGFFNGKASVEDWSYLFRAVQLSSRRNNEFYRCSVSSQQAGADNIIEALINVGFTPTGRVKSKHGRYFIYMLEWQKE